MHYSNNGFYSYVNLVYSEFSLKPTNSFLLKLFKIFPVIIWRTLKDAGIELFFLIVFWAILIEMSQGRDLIVSLFEPGGLYGDARIFFTTVAVVSYSISMWIIPASMFQLRENKTGKTKNPQIPFKEHLFFVHRVLPLVPFWLLAAALFNDKVFVFCLAALAELVFLYVFNHTVKSMLVRRLTMFAVLILLLILTIYFFYHFQELYTEMKIIFSINLYLMSIVMFFIFHEADERILKEHAVVDNPLKSVYRKYKINTITYAVCILLHTLAVLYIYYRPFKFNIAPESILLYMFSVYVFAIDLFFYFVMISLRRQLIAVFCGIILLALLISPLWNVNVSNHTIDAISDSSFFKGRDRDSFDDRYAELRKKIMTNQSGEPYPVVLVSGEGGGSRAGLWFSQNLINFDYDTKGKFREHIFSISTVSGSSVGLSTVFTFWDHTRGSSFIDTAWTYLPGEVFANNYVGSSIRGLLLTDLYKSIVPGKWKYDRNTTLQSEEAFTTERAVFKIFNDKRYNEYDYPDSLMTLYKDFMYFFYEQKNGKLSYRENTPITLINTCRSNDGRRGIFSSIKLNDSYFNEAIDIAGYLYEDSIRGDDGKARCKGIRKAISLGEACNTSELFPIFSVPAYIDSLGSFVDGGYHENSGLKSTLDVYQQLKMRLENDTELIRSGKEYKIYIMYLKNGSGEKQLYKRIKSEPTLLQPLKALFNQPFEGSASYFEEKAKFVSASDRRAYFIPINLNPEFVLDANKAGVKNDPKKEKLEKEILNDLIVDTIRREDGRLDTILNFPLARWLSKTVINRIKVNASPGNLGKEAKELLENVRAVHNVNKPVINPFDKYPQYRELQVQADSSFMNVNKEQSATEMKNKYLTK